MFITNGKVFTTRDQNDLETLEKFAEALFEKLSFSQQLSEPLNPEDYKEERSNFVCYRYAEGMTLDFVVAEGAEYLALELTDTIEKPGRTSVMYKYHFTAEEQSENADKLAHHVIEKSAIKSEIKEIQSTYKAKLDEKEAQINKYSQYVSSGFDMREEDCRVIINYEAKTKEFVSIKTNKTVKKEELQPEDYQFFMSFPEPVH